MGTWEGFYAQMTLEFHGVLGYLSALRGGVSFSFDDSTIVAVVLFAQVRGIIQDRAQDQMPLRSLGTKRRLRDTSDTYQLLDVPVFQSYCESDQRCLTL